MWGWLSGRDGAVEEAHARIADIQLEAPAANSFGVTSRGMAQVRGNGCLTLGRDKLVFVMWRPRSVLEISRQRFRGVEQVGSHLGKSRGIALVKLSFENEAGDDDSIAWYVRDSEAWMQALG